jgi:hypothetical protein
VANLAYLNSSLILLNYFSSSIIHAYALGYVTTTGPQLVSRLRILRRSDLSNGEKARYVSAKLNQETLPSSHVIGARKLQRKTTYS